MPGEGRSDYNSLRNEGQKHFAGKAALVATAYVPWTAWPIYRDSVTNLPEWERFHVMNILDGLGGHAILSLITWQLFLGVAMIQNRNKVPGATLPVALGFMALMGVGLYHELEQATLPGRAFDYTDMACYAGGAAVSSVASLAIHRHVQNRN